MTPSVPAFKEALRCPRGRDSASIDYGKIVQLLSSFARYFLVSGRVSGSLALRRRLRRLPWPRGFQAAKAARRRSESARQAASPLAGPPVP